MFEATLSSVGLFKKLIAALQDLVTDVNFEFSDEGLKLQAMDSSHVSLCKLVLDKEYFEAYRCDRTVNLGVNLINLGKILKCGNDIDSLTLKHGETADQLGLVIENEKQDKIMEFGMKLMEIEEDNLGVPDNLSYEALVVMNAAEFSKIVKDLSQLGDATNISVSTDGLKFAVEGEIGQSVVCVRGDQVAEEDPEMEQPVAEDEEEEDEEGEDGVKKESDIKDEDIKTEGKVQDEEMDEDEKENIKKEKNQGTKSNKSVKKENVIDSEAEESEEEADLDGPIDQPKKKSKRKTNNSDSESNTKIMVGTPVELAFALRYLKIFVAATSLSKRIRIGIQQEQPMMLEYPIMGKSGDFDVKMGYLKYYLAPKLDDDSQ